MTEEDNRQLSIFEARFRHLLYLYEQIKQKNDILTRELLQKDEKIKELEERCRQAEINYKDLKAARIISMVNPDIFHVIIKIMAGSDVSPEFIHNMGSSIMPVVSRI